MKIIQNFERDVFALLPDATRAEMSAAAMLQWLDDNKNHIPTCAAHVVRLIMLFRENGISKTVTE